MSRRPFATILASALVAGLGAASLWLQLREPPRAVPATLSGLPRTLHGYSGRDVPMEPGIVEMLDADYHVHRMYRDDRGVVFAYVGYYSTRRGGTPEHTPEICYQAQGWSITHDDVVPISGAAPLSVREIVVESAGRRELVMFWYRSFRKSGITSTVGLRLDHVVGQLEARRGDGALVRLSTPLEGDGFDSARARLADFARALEPALGTYWPVEYRSDHESRPASERLGLGW